MTPCPSCTPTWPGCGPGTALYEQKRRAFDRYVQCATKAGSSSETLSIARRDYGHARRDYERHVETGWVPETEGEPA